MEDRAEQGKLHTMIRKCYGHRADFLKAIDYHIKIAKEKEDQSRERGRFCNLGMAYQALGDFKQAICYHTRDLKTAQDLGDRAAEGRAYCHLGDAYGRLGDFNKALDYQNLGLEIAKEIRDRAKIGIAYGNLGKTYSDLGKFEEAKHYQQRHLEIAKDLGDKDGERLAYHNLGFAFSGLSDFKPALHYFKLCLEMAKEWRDRSTEGLLYDIIDFCYYVLEEFKNSLTYFELSLEIAREVGDKVQESIAYNHLSRSYLSLGDFKTAIDYSERCLKLAKRKGDTAADAYRNLSLAHRSLEDFKRAIECAKVYLKIAEQSGDRAREGNAYHVLGNVYESIGDSERALICSKIFLQIAKELGDRALEAQAYNNLATAYHSLNDLEKSIKYRLLSKNIDDVGCGRFTDQIEYYYRLGTSLESQGYLALATFCYKLSIRALNEAVCLQRDDKWKISIRDIYYAVHTSLWQVLLKQDLFGDALSAAERARAQALKELMKVKYGCELSNAPDEAVCGMSIAHSSNTVYTAYDEKKIVFWISHKRNSSSFRSRVIMSGNGYHGLNDMKRFWRSLIQTALDQNCVRAGVKCEDRSLDNLRVERTTSETLSGTRLHSSHLGLTEPNALKKLYDFIIGPVRDLLHSKELIVVPDGPLCLVPYAALRDANSKFLSESFSIRVIPSLTSLKLITECPADYHCRTGALLVGDPWVQEITYQGRNVEQKQLPCAKKEVEMIGRILKIAPLTGTEATKDAVLQRLSSVALVHIAAHGCMETGEIALAPNPTRSLLRKTSC